jgi:hypothetical protein
MSRIVHIKHNGGEFVVDLWDGLTAPSTVRQRISLPPRRGHRDRFYLRKVANPLVRLFSFRRPAKSIPQLDCNPPFKRR